jgi:hypothetical protein
MKNMTNNAITVIDFLNRNPGSTLREIQHELDTHHGGSSYPAYRVVSHIRWKIGKDVLPCQGNQYSIAATLSDGLAYLRKRHNIERSWIQHDQIMVDILAGQYPDDPQVAAQAVTIRALLAMLDA